MVGIMAAAGRGVNRIINNLIDEQVEPAWLDRGDRAAS
jgi:hypothetical protein